MKRKRPRSLQSPLPFFVRHRNVKCHPGKGFWSLDSTSSVVENVLGQLTESRGTNEDRVLNSPREMRDTRRYCYVYVLRSLADHKFYVGLTRDLRARLHSHNKGLIASTKRRIPFQLVYWEGCLNDSDAAQREKYLKTAWGKRYIKTRVRRYLRG